MPQDLAEAEEAVNMLLETATVRIATAMTDAFRTDSSIDAILFPAGGYRTLPRGYHASSADLSSPGACLPGRARLRSKTASASAITTAAATAAITAPDDTPPPPDDELAGSQ